MQFGCGYTVSSLRTVSGEPYRLAVAEVRDVGIDVDAAGWISTSVRHAVARGQGLQLASHANAHGELAVELVDVQIGLGSFAESGRTSRYQVSVLLRAKLTDAGGFVWNSAPVAGYAPFFSTPGPIESLDGAGRRALERAADDAAERLIVSLMVVLNRELTRIERSKSAEGAL